MPTPVVVLVVEDEPLVRLNIADELTERGFIVLEAGSADEAIVMLHAHPEIQVMFSDVDMPGSMDGMKLAAAVRDRWPPVRIILTSGNRKFGQHIPAESRFFGKPYEADSIALAMREMLAL